MEIHELYELVRVGEQRRNVELKRSISWDSDRNRAKIVKTILAMSNIRDGGYLVLGFSQQADSFEPVGVRDDHLSSFKYDNVKSHVALFADPFATFFMKIIEDKVEDKKFIVFSIDEFEEIPIICKRNGLENLREGDIYTRSRRMPSSVRVPTQSEMREIIDMAIEKGVRKFLEQSQRVGMKVEIGAEFDEYDRELEEIQ